MAKKNKCTSWEGKDVKWSKEVEQDRANKKKWREETKEEIKARNSTTWLSLNKQFLDRLAPIKKVIRETFDPVRAELIIRKMEVSTGGSALGMVEAQKALRDVYGDMSEEEENIFNEIILAERIIAIDKHKVAAARREVKQITGDERGTFRVFDTGNESHLKELRKALKDHKYKPDTAGSFVILKIETDKSNPKRKLKLPYEYENEAEAIMASSKEVDRILRESEILHPGHSNAAIQQQTLKEMEEKDPTAYRDMQKKVTQYFNIYKKQLEIMYDEGLISAEDYKHFKTVGKYSPRQYLKFFDPDITNDHLKALTTGSTGSINMDSANLLREYIISMHNRIARNKANVELYYAAKSGEGTGLVSIVDDAVEEKTGDNFKLISAYVGGKKYRLKMPLEIGRNWLESESGMSRDAAKTLRKWSGADIVRAGATGYNPEFAITNLPRDLMYSWFRTREYSNWVPMAIPQMAKRLWDVRKDVWHRGDEPIGKAKQYLEEYGMMDFMTQQGFFGGKAWKHYGSKSSWQKLQDMASFVGSKTELWVRLALREQAIMNRAAKNAGVVTKEMREQATWIARGYLDFSKGGSMVKTVDHVVPYLNASVIATTGLAETLFGKGGTGYHSKDSKYLINEGNRVAWFKMSQFFVIATSSIMANMLLWGDEYDRMDDDDKNNNLVIPLPFIQEIDELGRKAIGMFKVPLDQGQTMITSLAGALLGHTLRTMGYGNGDTVFDKYVNRRPSTIREGFMRGVPNLSAPPAIKAFAGLMNFDLYRMGPVFPGEPKENLGDEYAGKTPFDHPFLNMSVEKLNKLMPELGGLIPAEPFSPARIAFVFNTMFVPSNSFVKFVQGLFGPWTGFEKNVFGGNKIQEYEKMIDADVRDKVKLIPGVDRFFEMTRKENTEDAKRVDQITIRNNERELKHEAFIDAYLHTLNLMPPPKGKRSGLTPEANKLINDTLKYINKQEMNPQERKRARNKVLDAKSYKASVGVLDSPQFWYKVTREGNPQTRAEMIFYKWEKHPEGRVQLMREFRRLKRIANKNTRRYLNAYIRAFRERQEPNFRRSVGERN